jgi:hypothetical protein
MSDFDEKLRLKEKAEEDRYFAHRDRELIRALHEERARETPDDDQLTHPSPERPAATTTGRDRAQDQATGYPGRLLAKVLRFIKGGSG